MLGVGLAVGGIVLVHLQIALLTAWLLTAWAAVQAVRGRTWRPLAELAGAGAVALVVSCLVVGAAGGRHHRIRSTPARRLPGVATAPAGPGDLVMAFGVVAIFGLLGLAVVAARRPLPGRLALFGVWIVAFVPLVLVDRLVDGSDIVSERRVWLLVSIPLTVVAAATLTMIAARLRTVAVVALVASRSSCHRSPGRWPRSAWCATPGSRAGPAGASSTPRRGTRCSAT